mgnify:CR=1 FL=1
MKKVLSLIIVFLFVFSAIPAMAKDDAPDLDHEIVVPIGQMVIIGDAHLTGYMDQIEVISLETDDGEIPAIRFLEPGSYDLALDGENFRFIVSPAMTVWSMEEGQEETTCYGFVFE